MKRFRELKEKVEKPTGDLKSACWKGYTAVGMKEKNGRKVPNCVPVKEAYNTVSPKNWEDQPMIAARKKDNEPPFAGPYSKTPASTTDKSGAKHSPYSRVRHLARMAAQREMDKLKKPVKEEVEVITEGSTGWHPSSTVKNPNFNDELSIRRVSPPGKRLKSGKLDYNERTSQERLKSLMKFKKAKGGLTGPKGKLPEEVEHLEEGRPSQRHPLEGHPYHKKSESELHYIVKDAGEAAKSLKGTRSEGKYLDQVNDASTVLHFRKTSGSPDWYKKKYGHVKEEVEQIEELSTELLGRYKKGAGVQASAANKAGDVKKGNKRFSGIMKATLKQFKNDAKKYQKEEVEIDEQHREEGRFKPTVPHKVPNVSVGKPSVRKTDGAKRVDIVRSVAKKTAVVKDKFEPNPELNTTLTKNV